MASAKVTINDVAAAAGVSRQTVTRAMNAMSEISPETRDRVLGIAEDLGYRPSRFAQNLARQKHHSLGMVVATLRNPYYTDFAADLLDEVVGRGWQTIIGTSEGIGDADVLQQLIPHVDAIVGYFDADEAELLRMARGVPIVLVERAAHQPGIHSIALDFDTGIRDLLSALRDRGSRRFAMIDSRNASGVYQPTGRRLAFERALAGENPLITTSDEVQSSAGAAFTTLLETDPGIDTVIVFNDVMAMGVLHRAHEMRLRVPEEVRVVGIDGLSIGDLTSPRLTSLSIDRHAIARHAAEMVEMCLASGARESITRTVVPTPLWRASA